MPTLGFEEAVRHCAKIGYDSVELTVSEGWPTDVMTIGKDEPAQWKRILGDTGIVITSLTANAPLLVSDEDWKVAKVRLERSLELAAELSTESHKLLPISLGAHRALGDTPAGPTPFSEERWQLDRNQIIERFAELSVMAKTIGARVALEAHVGSVVSLPERAAAVYEAVNHEAFGLNVDVSHFAVQGIPNSRVVDMLGKLAIVCEVKDQSGLFPDFKFQIPGEGTFDYADFIGRMAAAGYDGSISVEISVLRQRLEGYDTHAAAVQSYAVLSKAFEAAGVKRSK